MRSGARRGRRRQSARCDRLRGFVRPLARRRRARQCRELHGSAIGRCANVRLVRSPRLAEFAQAGRRRLRREERAHVGDVAAGLFEAMHRVSGAPFATANVASGVPTRLKRLIEAVAFACGGDPAAVEARPPRPGDVGGTFADVAAAEEILGWRAEIDLEIGLARTAAWYASDASEPWRDPTPESLV